MTRKAERGDAPLRKNGQVLALLDGKEIGDAALERLALLVVEREEGRDLGQDEDRVLDVHVTPRLEALDEALQVWKMSV